MPVTALPDRASPWFHDTLQVVTHGIYRPFYRISVDGLSRVPRDRPLVLVANHSSLVEPQILFGMIPRRVVFLVKEELFTGILGWGLRKLGQIPVQRGTSTREPLLAAIRVLRDDGVVAVFPEGTRGDGDVGHAHQGAAWLVRNSGATVLPVAIRGTKRPSDGRRRLRPRVDVLIGDPFPLRVGPGQTGLAEATEGIRRTLAALVRTVDRDRGEAIEE